MAEVEVDFSNLNVAPRSLPEVNGAMLADFVGAAGYGGAERGGIEWTPFRAPIRAKILGRYATELVSGLHASWAGRTFPGAVKDLIVDSVRDRQVSERNVKGVMYTAAMKEVWRSTQQLVGMQEKVGPLDAVLYPQSGDSLRNLDYREISFRHRTFQPTAEVLHRWGIPVVEGAPNDELLAEMYERMEDYGFDAVTLDALHARRSYIDENGQSYKLPEGFIDEMIDQDEVVLNFHAAVGRTDVLQPSDPLFEQTLQEAEALYSDNPEALKKTQLGDWLERSIGAYAFEGAFRVTIEQPGSIKVEDGRIVDLDKHRRAVHNLKAVA